jgi:hypothetical protein
MSETPHYSAESFPADFLTGLLAATMTALVSGPAIWWLSLRYLERAYPSHPELAPAAIVAGVLDGCVLGLFAFAVTFAVRLWRRERAERKRSDEALRLALEAIHAKRDDESASRATGQP